MRLSCRPSKAGGIQECHASYEDGVPVSKMFIHATPRSNIAIVGPTGAGKTTIHPMLTRFYDVTYGSVRLDGMTSVM